MLLKTAFHQEIHGWDFSMNRLFVDQIKAVSLYIGRIYDELHSAWLADGFLK